MSMRVFESSAGCAATREVSPESSNAATTRTHVRGDAFPSALIVSASLMGPSYGNLTSANHTPACTCRSSRGSSDLFRVNSFEHDAGSQHPVIVNERSPSHTRVFLRAFLQGSPVRSMLRCRLQFSFKDGF